MTRVVFNPVYQEVRELLEAMGVSENEIKQGFIEVKKDALYDAEVLQYFSYLEELKKISEHVETKTSGYTYRLPQVIQLSSSEAKMVWDSVKGLPVDKKEQLLRNQALTAGQNNPETSLSCLVDHLPAILILRGLIKEKYPQEIVGIQVAAFVRCDPIYSLLTSTYEKKELVGIAFSEKQIPDSMKKHRKYVLDLFSMQGGSKSLKGLSVLIDSENGYLLTAGHVLGPQAEDLKNAAYQMGIYYNNEFYPVEVVARDKKSELTLLRIVDFEKSPWYLKSFAWIRRSALGVGEDVVAVGPAQYTLGSTNAINRRSREVKSNLILLPGYSGGGLFDESGQLIGVNAIVSANNGTASALSVLPEVNASDAFNEKLHGIINWQDGKMKKAVETYVKLLSEASAPLLRSLASYVLQ